MRVIAKSSAQVHFKLTLSYYLADHEVHTCPRTTLAMTHHALAAHEYLLWS
jgi:hypothetical protein